MGQPAHRGHLAERNRRLRHRQTQRQGRRLGGGPVDAFAQTVLHRRQRDDGAAGTGVQRVDRVAEKKLRDAHVNLASPVDLAYTLNLTTLPTQAATLAEKLKTSGATSVVFAGDPIMPIYLTKACATIGYFPEWIITGIVLTDTSAPGPLLRRERVVARVRRVQPGRSRSPSAAGDADHLYRWWYGANTSPASLAAPAILPAYQQFFTGVQLAGPHLTPQTYTEGLFRAPPTGGGPTSPLQAYGYQGAAPHPSYSSPADYTFLWYDATAKGPDEEGTVGSGLMQYVNGGARYKAGVVPTGPVPMFSTAGAVTTLRDPARQGAVVPGVAGVTRRLRALATRSRRGASPRAKRPVAAFFLRARPFIL